MATAVGRGHRRGSSSASSSSSSTLEASQVEAPDGPNVRACFEQRRVRDITTILVRNLNANERAHDVAASGSARSLHRPSAPLRALSTASNASGHTLRRSASNRTLRPSARRRASSAASIHESTRAEAVQESLEDRHPSRFLAWDLQALRPALHERLTRAYVTLSTVEGDSTFYETPLSGSAGMNHAWGLAPDSESDHDGIDLGFLEDEVRLDGAVKVSLWTCQLDDDGERTKQIKMWDSQVSLSNLTKIPETAFSATSSSTLPWNTVILGLRPRISTMTAPEMDDGGKSGEQSRRFRDPRRKTDAIQYYLLPSNARQTLTENTKSPQAHSKADCRRWLKEGKMVRAYEVDDILRILQMQHQHAGLLVELEGLRARIDERLHGGTDAFTGVLAYRRKQEDLAMLVSQRESARERVKEERRLKDQKQQSLAREKARLEIAKRLLVSRKAHYDELRSKMVQLARLRERTEVKLFSRRVVLLRQVERIYPIELIDGAQLLFSIVGVPLATKEAKDERAGWKEKGAAQKGTQDDDTVSSALGLIAQMVALISAYTDTPLHYPIATAGSRSVIQDAISAMSGPRTFPLFAKGAEQYRFEYGHFLLNKNIEQLMNHAGITILDIRNTLPNLKNLIVTLTASNKPSSKLSRRNHVGEQTISLHAGIGGGKELDRSIIGLGRPMADGTVTGHGTQQLGYGTVVDPGDAMGEAAASKMSGSRWGMSLLGWGNVRNHADESKRTPPIGDGNGGVGRAVPTVRTLGKGR